MDSEILTVHWAMLFDSLTVSMLLAVLVVSSLVHLFSTDYMATDPHNQRFFAYLSLFTFFILVLVTGSNYPVLFLGWEGIGICSYLLIGFWYTRLQANKSAIKALVVNRVGDMFLSIAFFTIFLVFGSLDYATISTLTPIMNESSLTLIGILLLLAAIGKSAQLGLHTWLPDAMEGPTPVSALIHAATLVTAGVYLLLRSSPILEYAPMVLVVITWVGALTAFFAASTGLLQNDLKRVIAYSTCSQMGYLFIACGLSQYDIALFHLVNHAFFKALLFLAAGAVLHSVYDTQDMRRLGGLIGLLPFTYTAILVGSLSLMALPWITGYYSKEVILLAAYGQYHISGSIAYWLGTISASLTAFYSLRLISLTFLTTPNASKIVYSTAHDAPPIVIIPLVSLGLLAIFFGYIARDAYIGIGTDFLAESVYIHPSHILMVETEFSPSLRIKILPTVLTLIGAMCALVLYNFLPKILVLLTKYNVGRQLYAFFNGKYFVDIVYTQYIINTSLGLAYIISKVVDRGIVEIIGPNGLSTGIYKGSTNITDMDSGNLTDYALYFIVGLTILVLTLFAPLLLPSISLDIRLVLLAGLGLVIQHTLNSKN